MDNNLKIRRRTTFFSIRVAAAFAVSLGVVSYGPVSTSGANTSYQAILAKLPPDVRTQFLEKLTFMNGGLAGAYIGGVKHKLTRADYIELLAQLGISFGRLGEDHEHYECAGAGQCHRTEDYICDPGKCPSTGTDPVGAITMLGFLSSAPASVRAEFLQSLDFVNGRLVSATVSGVSTYLKPAEFERLFARVGVPASELRLRTTGGRFRASGW
jgi:hypothetical protein